MFWFFLGIVAVWVVIGALVAHWVGRSIAHADLEDSAHELRRVDAVREQSGSDVVTAR